MRVSGRAIMGAGQECRLSEARVAWGGGRWALSFERRPLALLQSVVRGRFKRTHFLEGG